MWATLDAYGCISEYIMFQENSVDTHVLSSATHLFPFSYVLLTQPNTLALLYCMYTFAEIDECLEGTHNCSENARCEKVAGGYTCVCGTGLEWNGNTCTGISKIQTILSSVSRES